MKIKIIKSHSVPILSTKPLPTVLAAMAYSSHSFLLALLLIFNLLLALTGKAVAAREIPAESKNVDKKKPDLFIDSDGSVLIPGVGRVMVLSLGGIPSLTPYGGGTGSTDDGGSYLPGGDDTFIPNPGFEVPNPAGGVGGSIPATAQP